MAVLVFLTSSGFAVYYHSCLMSGDREVRMHQIASCCVHDPNPSPAEIDASCCYDNTGYLKIDFNASQDVHHPVQPVFCSVVAIIPDAAKDLQFHSAGIYKDLPPPKDGRTLLAENNILRI